MGKETKVALVGLDTSHTVEFVKRMQAPDCPPDQKVEGLRAASCLRFPSPFQSEEGQDARQKQLEGWGVKVMRNFDEAVSGCDAIMIEINDPSFHLEYFKKCANLKKPIFLDKPLADKIGSGAEIARIAKEKALRIFSSSSLRFVPELLGACAEMPASPYATVYGPLGEAPAGSSVVWYGVHAFEMLERAMGIGASCVTSLAAGSGVVAVIDYPDRRRGIVELTIGAWQYGGCLRNGSKAVAFSVDMSRAYKLELDEVAKFFGGGEPPVAMEDTVEVMALLDAADRSAKSGRTEAVYRK